MKLSSTIRVFKWIIKQILLSIKFSLTGLITQFHWYKRDSWIIELCPVFSFHVMIPEIGCIQKQGLFQMWMHSSSVADFETICPDEPVTPSLTRQWSAKSYLDRKLNSSSGSWQSFKIQMKFWYFAYYWFKFHICASATGSLDLLDFGYYTDHSLLLPI